MVRLLCFGWLLSLGGCGVTSWIPGFGGGSGGLVLPSAGEPLHLRVSSEDAISILREVATRRDWKMVRTGDQLDLRGPRGKYFWLETRKFIGGKEYVSGVFYDEPTGVYVIVGDESTGLPESLVAPLISAVEARTGKRWTSARPATPQSAVAASSLPPPPSSPKPPPRSSAPATVLTPIPAAAPSTGTVAAPPPSVLPLPPPPAPLPSSATVAAPSPPAGLPLPPPPAPLPPSATVAAPSPPAGLPLPPPPAPLPSSATVAAPPPPAGLPLPPPPAPLPAASTAAPVQPLPSSSAPFQSGTIPMPGQPPSMPPPLPEPEPVVVPEGWRQLQPVGP